MKLKVGDRVHLEHHPQLTGTVLSCNPEWLSYMVRFDNLGLKEYDLGEKSLVSLVVEPDETEAYFV